jgi:lysozyme family protein
MADIAALKKRNAERWAAAKLTRASELSKEAGDLLAAKSRYKAVEGKTGVPWAVIAVIHQRESSQDWTRSLAQGDPWSQVSTHHPAGRGPFNSWEAAAVDALKNCHPYLAKHKDWSAGGTLTALEQYNGLGYYNRGIPSPYVWSGTDQYVKGKFIADGVFAPDTVDKQLGCAGLLKVMQQRDSSARFGAPTPVTAGGAAAGTVVAGGAGAVVAKSWGADWGPVIAVIALSVVLALLFFTAIKKFKKN